MRCLIWGRWAVNIAKDDGQSVFIAADDHDFRIRGLSQCESGFDATPAQIRIRDALTDSFLERGDAIGLNLLAF